MTALGILWFILIAVLIIGFFVLDGFDLGVGVLYPFLGKGEETKRIMRTAVGPVWDGNEVWLLTAGGALFAAFAPAYAASFSGFYLAIMLVLFGLIIRAVSVEYRSHEPGQRASEWLSGKESACNSGDAGDVGSIPELGRSLGEGHATHSSILAWRIP